MFPITYEIYYVVGYMLSLGDYSSIIRCVNKQTTDKRGLLVFNLLQSLNITKTRST